jgi:hypothetical protein
MQSKRTMAPRVDTGSEAIHGHRRFRSSHISCRGVPQRGRLEAEILRVASAFEPRPPRGRVRADAFEGGERRIVGYVERDLDPWSAR